MQQVGKAHFNRIREARSVDRGVVQGTCSVSSVDCVLHNVQLIDLSPAGVRFRTPDALPQGPLDIAFSAGERLAVQVVWSIGDRHGCRFVTPLTTRRYLQLRTGLLITHEDEKGIEPRASTRLTSRLGFK